VDFAYRTTRDDFRYYPAFPSLSEKNGTILMLRIDPADPAGAGNGSIVSSREYTYYGSYSARLRIPDTGAVQPNIGVCADLTLYDEDSVYGLDEVTLELRLADPKHIYTRISHLDAGESGDPASEQSFLTPSLSSFNASAKFYIYGFDWTEGKISWWIQTSESSSKTVLAETEENVPSQPLRLMFRFYHSKLYPAEGNASSTQAPLYPFELELDWIKYKPLE